MSERVDFFSDRKVTVVTCFSHRGKNEMKELGYRLCNAQQVSSTTNQKQAKVKFARIQILFFPLSLSHSLSRVREFTKRERETFNEEPTLLCLQRVTLSRVRSLGLSQ